MKTCVSSLLIALHVLASAALLVKSPEKTQALVEQHQQQTKVQTVSKLNPALARDQWLSKKHSMRVHMLAEGQPTEKELARDLAVQGCIACKGVQVVYGKYRSADGDQTDNSYYVFKDPAIKDPTTYLPVVIQFHSGGFFSGSPWQIENDEIKGYLSKGFAVVSAGYRLVTEKYFYEGEDGTNRTEELIHVSKEGHLSLDTTGKTMDDYEVRVGKQEFITKYLYDATQMIEHLIRNYDKFGLDVTRIVFVGESSGGAAMQYLTWVYHQWHVGRYTPRGIVYNNAQLNYPVNNMLGETWDLFAETMGPQVKLADVVSPEACPTIIGNHMCGSALGNTSDYELCNVEWNERSLREFCGEALKSATLGQARARQVWTQENNTEELGKGMEKLWYASENMQHHLPSDPFYIYVSNSMNGTGPVDVSHHSIFALNFAKFAEMGKHGGHQYTVYYTDFAHMSDADRGMQRLEVLRDPPSIGGLALPPAAAAPPVAAAPSAFMPPMAPAPAPGPAAPAFEVASSTVFNYLSTHGWREDVAEARDIEAASLEERILYACLAVGIGPFRAVENTTAPPKESGVLESTLPNFGVILAAFIGLLSSSF